MHSSWISFLPLLSCKKISILLFLTTAMEISKMYPENLYNLEKIIIMTFTVFKRKWRRIQNLFPLPAKFSESSWTTFTLFSTEVMMFLIAQLASLRTQQNSQFNMRNWRWYSLPDKQKLKKFITTRLVLQEMWQGLKVKWNRWNEIISTDGLCLRMVRLSISWLYDGTEARHIP